jgi:hypothetical protein
LQGDLDGNGKSEIIVLNDFNTTSIYRNRIDEPVIESFSPKEAKNDSSITIKGAHFSTATHVQLGSVHAAAFQIISDSIIVATIKDGATGVVKVSNPYGEDTLGGFTYIPPVPKILSFSPTTGTVGSEIQIRGQYLGSVHAIRFGGINASSFTKTGDTLITAIIGKGSTGNIVISAHVGNDSIGPFTFIPPLPVLSSFWPSVGTTGTLVSIKGRHLNWTREVSFGNTKAASFTILSDTLITAVVADGNTGIVKVETDFGTVSSNGFIFLQKDAVVAYPNPASGFMALAHPSVESTSNIKVLDNNGSVIKTIKVSEKTSNTKIDLTELKPGIYRIVWSDSKNSLQYSILIR